MKPASEATPLNAKAPFLVLDASAGSGKTYNLVQHILMNALRPSGMSNGYQKVLAITFTNNAADEMKARLLKQLLEFSNEEYPSKSVFFRPIWEALELHPKELQKRAAVSARHMLHNYSTLNVGTIDQFTHRLVRTFTKDLDLEDNFEIRLDLDAMIKEALDSLYSSIGDYPGLKESFVALVNDRLSKDKGHNPDRDLHKEGKNSFNEDHWKYLEALPEPQRLLEIEQELGMEIDSICAEGKALSNEARRLAKEEDLETRTSYFKFVKTQLLGNWQDLRKNPLKAGANVWKSRVKENGAFWDEFIKKAQDFEQRHQSNLLLLKEATSKLKTIAATKTLLTKFRELQKSQNTMPLSSFNKLIAEELDKEPAAFIYARLGEKYWHFYIDEFQDTSVVQFENLHPLIEHSLTKDEYSNSALIVGDAKQSIYRWRGGKAEQFISLVDNDHLINRFQRDQRGHELYPRETVRLENNYRTHGAIVNFNNDFFSSLQSQLGLNTHQEVYSKARVYQNAVKDSDKGEVSLDVLEAQNAEELKTLACEKAQEKVQELLHRGHLLSDMAILVRGNSDGKRIANHLAKAGYPVLSSDSLVLGNAHEGKLLLAAFKLYLNSRDAQAWFSLAHALVRQGKIPEANAFEFERNVVKSGVLALIGFFPRASELLQSANSMFEFAIRTFDLFGLLKNSNGMVDAALDLVYEFQSRQGGFATLPAWWQSEAVKRNVEVPQDANAVRVMTIHKSKGLEFKHVIIPFDIGFKPDSSDHWIDFPLHPEIDKMPVSFKKEHKSLFQEELVLELESKNKFDWINMVYVAFTRPISGLHIFLNGGNKPGLLSTTLTEHLGLKEQANWNCGSPVLPKQEPESPKRTLPQMPYSTMTTTEVKMAKTAPENWHNGGVDARRWGSALHRILQSPAAVRPQGLKRLYRSGEFSYQLHERAQHILDTLASNPEFAILESEGTVVYTERSVIDPEHSMRPDLIIQKERSAVVIDYKTGLPKPEYDDQLNAYIDALQSTFDTVSGKLLYI